MPSRMSSLSVILTTVVLLTYFTFTSGLVYEAMGSSITDRLVVPYSIALSGERTGLVGIFTEDDQRCAEWIARESRDGIPVVCCGNVGLLLRGYAFAQTEQMTRFVGSFSDKPHYIFLSTWNMESGKAVVGAWTAGLRDVDRIPALGMERYHEVFRSGKAVIYERRLP